MRSLQHIWVTYDGHEAADRALVLAVELARPLGARLTLVHVDDPALGEDEPLDDRPGTELLPSAPGVRWRARLRGLALAQRDVDVRPLVVVGAVHSALRDLLQRVQPDLVVIATGGVGRPWDVARGGVAHHLLRHTSVPLLVLGPRAGTGHRAVAVAHRDRAYSLRTLVGRSRVGRLINTSDLPVLVDPR